MKLCAICGSPEHPEWKAHAFAPKGAVTPIPTVSNASVSAVSNVRSKVAARVQKHRDKDRAAYNAMQRKVMRKRRASKKT